MDHISGYTPSIEAEDNDWWKWIAAAVLLVLLILLLFPLLPYLVKGLVWLVLLPFKGIAALCKAIKNAAARRKSRKRQAKAEEECGSGTCR